MTLKFWLVLTKAYEARVFLHVHEIHTASFKEHSCNGFSKQNYGLFKQTIDVDDVSCNDEVKEESDDDCSQGKYFFYVNIRMHRK